MGRLHHVDTRNLKEIVIEGLRMKLDELGELHIPFRLTMDYPSLETFRRDRDGNEITERRIVVQRPRTSVSHYALGQNAAADDYFPEQERYQGWLEESDIEISVWTTDSKDRDNITELIKIWMLELEQGQLGEYPFFSEHGVQAVTFQSAYEEENFDLIQNGAMYIGLLNYRMLATFFNKVEPDELIRYKINLMARVRDCIEL